MYVRFFYGRQNPDQIMTDSGKDGPIIGPANISWTYGNLRINMEHLLMEFDMIYFDGVYYGDVEIIDKNDPRVVEAEQTGNLLSFDCFLKQLDIDRNILAEWKKCPQVLLYIEDGVIQEIIATCKLKIKVVDFDVFEGGEPEPYDCILMQHPDKIIKRGEFDNTHVRTQYDEKYRDYEQWKANFQKE